MAGGVAVKLTKVKRNVMLKEFIVDAIKKGSPLRTAFFPMKTKSIT